MSSTVTPELSARLGYLLKHAQERLRGLTTAALAPHGIDGRQLAVLLVLAEGEPPSQHEAAGRLGIDRTTMVGLLDALEEKRLVARRPDARDRRRNVVALTDTGRRTLAAARTASTEAERRFLERLTASQAEQFRVLLRTVVLDA